MLDSGTVVHCTDADLVRPEDCLMEWWDFRQALTIATTSGNLYFDGLLSNPGPGLTIRTAYNVTLEKVVVNAQHGDATPPTTWDFNAVKNSAVVAPTEKMTVAWNATIGVEQQTVGVLDAPINIDAGSDYFWCYSCSFSIFCRWATSDSKIAISLAAAPGTTWSIFASSAAGGSGPFHDASNWTY